ncbi:MAG: DUF2798 domain-containing protein [Jannaschia sp.]
MVPARFAPALFGFILSGLMSCLVSGFATVRAAGFVEGVFGLWMGAWIGSWIIAFPTVLVVAPVTRRLVKRLTASS